MPFDGHPMTFQYIEAAHSGCVREMLMRMRADLDRSNLPPRLAGDIELATAEALNNSVEHACAGLSDALLRLSLNVNAAHVIVQIEDPGTAMPGGFAPTPQPRDLDVPVAALPEGGFGWALIQRLTDRLHYSRMADWNRLQMWFVVGRDSAS